MEIFSRRLLCVLKSILAASIFGVLVIMIFGFLFFGFFDESRLFDDSLFDINIFLIINRFFFYYLGGIGFVFFIVLIIHLLLNYKLQVAADKFAGIVLMLCASCALSYHFRVDILNTIPGGYLGMRLYEFADKHILYHTYFLIILLWATLVMTFGFRWSHPISIMLREFFTGIKRTGLMSFTKFFKKLKFSNIDEQDQIKRLVITAFYDLQAHDILVKYDKPGTCCKTHKK